MLMRAGLRRFRRDRKGLAAVEFALILPALIVVLFGVVEASLALTARSDVINIASTAADLVAQESSVTPADMSNVFSAASAILAPYKTDQLTVTIYSIIDNGTSTGQVAWSCTKTGSAAAATGPSSPPTDGYGTSGNPSKGGDIIKATNLDSNGTPQYGGGGSVIIAKVDYPYASPSTKVITGTINMSNMFYTKPRRVAQIAKPSSCS